MKVLVTLCLIIWFSGCFELTVVCASKDENTKGENRDLTFPAVPRQGRILNKPTGSSTSLNPTVSQKSTVLPKITGSSTSPNPTVSQKSTVLPKITAPTININLNTVFTTLIATTTNKALGGHSETAAITTNSPHPAGVVTGSNRAVWISVGILFFLGFIGLALFGIRYCKIKEKCQSQFHAAQSTATRSLYLLAKDNATSKSPVSLVTSASNGSSSFQPMPGIKNPVYATIEYLPTRCSHIEEIPALPLTQQMGDFEVIIQG